MTFIVFPSMEKGEVLVDEVDVSDIVEGSKWTFAVKSIRGEMRLKRVRRRRNSYICLSREKVKRVIGQRMKTEKS